MVARLGLGRDVEADKKNVRIKTIVHAVTRVMYTEPSIRIRIHLRSGMSTRVQDSNPHCPTHVYGGLESGLNLTWIEDCAQRQLLLWWNKDPGEKPPC
jgi:hypothetical protein